MENFFHNFLAFDVPNYYCQFSFPEQTTQNSKMKSKIHSFLSSLTCILLVGLLLFPQFTFAACTSSANCIKRSTCNQCGMQTNGKYISCQLTGAFQDAGGTIPLYVYCDC